MEFSFKKKNVPKVIIYLLTFVCAALLFYHFLNYFPSNEYYLKRNRSRIKKAIKRSADFLVSQCNADGTFVYSFDLRDKFKVDKSNYNLVRHAGALYALANYAVENKSPELINAIVRCGNFLKSRIYDLKNVRDASVILSLVDLKDRGKLTKVKLGGVGLGLAALLSIEKIKKGFTDLRILKKLANFIVYMQKPDGEFASIYYTDKNKKDDSWTSLYYPGEAMLGLVMLYEVDRNPLWIATVGKGMLYLSSQRQGKSNVPPDHWTLIATEKMLKYYEEIASIILKSDLFYHAAQVSKNILKNKSGFRYNSLNFGAMTSDARTTPTATRLEGILAAYKFLPESFHRIRTKIKRRSHWGINFLINSQIKNGKNSGAIPKKVIFDESGNSISDKNLEEKDSETRIDYVQHALSAMIEYRDIFLAD